MLKVTRIHLLLDRTPLAFGEMTLTCHMEGSMMNKSADVSTFLCLNVKFKGRWHQYRLSSRACNIFQFCRFGRSLGIRFFFFCINNKVENSILKL
jgi:hypothetical protein